MRSYEVWIIDSFTGKNKSVHFFDDLEHARKFADHSMSKPFVNESVEIFSVCKLKNRKDLKINE